jgi:SagB-type dehydrogenase family enzyme
MRRTGIDFMKQTRFGNFEASGQMIGLPQPPLEVPYTKDGMIIDLPVPESIRVPDLDLRDAIEERESVRQYCDLHLTITELAYLLWCTQGVRERHPGIMTLRNVPSAGARHAIETYLLINRVDGIRPGLYRYLALGHRLVEEDTREGIATDLTAACLNQQFIRNSAVAFFWTADMPRMTWRYGERGYRYIHLDAGHICQNLYLSAESIGCGTCAIGAFHDNEVNSVLGIDGVTQFVVYLATVGKKRE